MSVPAVLDGDRLTKCTTWILSIEKIVRQARQFCTTLNNCLSSQIALLEDKSRKLKAELKKVQDKNRQADGEVGSVAPLNCLFPLLVQTSHSFPELLWVTELELLNRECDFSLYMHDIQSPWLVRPCLFACVWWCLKLVAVLLPSLAPGSFTHFYFFPSSQTQHLSRTVDELKDQLNSSQDKIRKHSQEATRRDEQLVVLKVELATLQEKHRLAQEEVRCSAGTMRHNQGNYLHHNVNFCFPG